MIGFHMHTDHIRPRLDETLQVMIRPRDHEVHIEKDVIELVHALHQRRAEGDIVDKMAIHHIEVHPVRPCSHSPLHLCFQAGKIRRQQRRGHKPLIKMLCAHTEIQTRIDRESHGKTPDQRI